MKTTMKYLIKKNSIAFIILLLTVFSGFAQNGKGVFIGSLAKTLRKSKRTTSMAVSFTPH